MRNSFRSHVLRAAVVGGLCLAAVPSLVLAQKGGRTNKTANSEPSSESMSNTMGRKIRGDLEDRDPINFLLKRDKQLSLTAAQKDSLKTMHKALEEEQKPIFKELQKVLTEAERDASVSGGRASAPPVTRELVGRLNEVQNAYTPKARAQLTADQLKIADSLQVTYDAELKEKADKERGKRG